MRRLLALHFIVTDVALLLADYDVDGYPPIFKLGSPNKTHS
jgi:hypothetical protein